MNPSHLLVIDGKRYGQANSLKIDTWHFYLKKLFQNYYIFLLNIDLNIYIINKNII